MESSMKRNDKENVYAEEQKLIKEAESRNRLVVFVGAGVSIPSGMPSWSTAIKEIKQHLGKTIEESDILKIPQYYYNEHGKNNYVALMRKIFKYGKHLYPNEIHLKILDFRTRYIITTNYDHLLEQAAFEKNLVLDVVGNDRDLAYGIAEKTLIKMHGDFEHDNFVLKEDDYLHYSDTFRLIETYLKALVAGNVVLFLGYSFSDPDLKQIFEWIKSILGGDKPYSYIVEVGEEFSLEKVNYLKNFGIKILYASEKLGDWKELKLENRLKEMIDFLQSTISPKNELDKIYQDLKPFTDMNYMYSRYIRQAFSFRQAFDWRDVATTLDKFTSSNRDEDNEKKKAILNILEKSIVNFADTEEHSPFPKGQNSEIKKICLAIYHYDVDSLKELSTENETRLSDNQPQTYLQQAFLLYCLSEYIESYNYLKKSTAVCYHNEMYGWYFISILNRSNLSRIIQNPLICDQNKTTSICSEMRSIDLEKIFQSLPDMGNNHNQYLKELYTFEIFYILFQDSYKAARKVKKETSTRYLIHSGVPRFISLRNQIEDLWYYITCNFLLFDLYEECSGIFNIYGRKILESVLAPDINDTDYFEVTALSVRPTELEDFDLFVVLRYVELKDIEQVVSESGNNLIPIDSRGKEYLRQVLPNCKKCKDLRLMLHSDLFWKILYIACHIELDAAFILDIITELRHFMTCTNICMYGDSICRFIRYVIQQNRMLSESDEFLLELHRYLELVLENIQSLKNENSKTWINTMNIVYLGISLYKKRKDIFVSNKMSNILMDDTYLDLSAYLYPILDEKNQVIVKNVAQQRKWENNIDVWLLSLLVRNGVIELNEDIENILLDYVKCLKDDRKTNMPSKYELALQEIINLYILNLLKRKDEFASFIRKSEDPLLIWAIEPDNFDYDKFDLNWLSRCSESFLRALQNNEHMVSMIRKKFRETYVSSPTTEKLTMIYFKYFAL